MTQADNPQKQMKKHLLILLFTAALTIPAQAQEYPKYQFNFGWGGFPFLEWAMYGTPPFIDVKIDPVDSFLNLNQIYPLDSFLNRPHSHFLDCYCPYFQNCYQ